MPLWDAITIRPNRPENKQIDGRVQLSADSLTTDMHPAGVNRGEPKGGTAKTAKLPLSLFTKRYQLEIMQL